MNSKTDVFSVGNILIQITKTWTFFSPSNVWTEEIKCHIYMFTNKVDRSKSQSIEVFIKYKDIKQLDY